MIAIGYVIDAFVLLIYAYGRHHTGDDRPGIRRLRSRLRRLPSGAVGNGLQRALQGSLFRRVAIDRQYGDQC